MLRLEVAALYAGVNILILLVLAVLVVAGRRKHKITLGHGDNEAFGRAVRAHGNAAEYMPAGLVGLTFLAPFVPPPPHLVAPSHSTPKVVPDADLVLHLVDASDKWRDEEMRVLDLQYPDYGFALHKGYPTAAHLAALARFGPCPIHRRSFAPVRAAVAQCAPDFD